MSYSSLDALFSQAPERADIETQVLGGDFVLLEYAALEYLEHIKAWMKNKSSQDSFERISAVLSQLFRIRENSTFNGSASSEPFVVQFAPFEENPEFQQTLTSAASFQTGAKIGMTPVDGKHDMARHVRLKRSC